MILTDVLKAKCAEDLFGDLVSGTAQEQEKHVRSMYRRWSKLLHPDLHYGKPSQDDATRAFQHLGRLWEQFKEKLAEGTYGDHRPLGEQKFEPVTITVKNSEITVTGIKARGELSMLYKAKYQGQDAILKIASNSSNNDLLQAEEAALKKLWQDDSYTRYRSFVPKHLMSFRYRSTATEEPRYANLLQFAADDLYSLEQVRQHHGNLDQKDMVWMFRRLLLVLGFAHRSGLVHGAVTPDHVLIQPEQHGLILIDWAYSVNNQDTIKAISAKYKGWHPKEVISREQANAATDVYMAAKCMAYLLGENPNTFAKSSSKDPILSFLRGCTLTQSRWRPHDAWKLLLELDELIQKLWGPRTFRLFSMAQVI